MPPLGLPCLDKRAIFTQRGTEIPLDLYIIDVCQWDNYLDDSNSSIEGLSARCVMTSACTPLALLNMVWPFSSKPSDYLDEDLAEYSKKAPQELLQPQQQPAKPQLKREVVSNTKSLPQIAMDNCVEFEREYSNCLRSGNYSSRFTGCQSQKQMHDKCVQLQSEALKMLGYASAATTAEKVKIKGKADDLMIQVIPGLSISNEQVEEFQKQLEGLASV